MDENLKNLSYYAPYRNGCTHALLATLHLYDNCKKGVHLKKKNGEMVRKNGAEVVMAILKLFIEDSIAYESFIEYGGNFDKNINIWLGIDEKNKVYAFRKE